MNRERIALISLFPLGNMGGGEFLTLNTLKAVAATGAQCRLYAAQREIPPLQPLNARLTTEFLQVFDSESRQRPASLAFKDVLAACADFDVVWVHQYLSNDLVFDLINTVASDQTLLLTNEGHEPLLGLFNQIYQWSPNHWCVEISNFSRDRAAGYTRQTIGPGAGAWNNQLRNGEQLTRPFRHRACCIGRILPHKGVEISIEGLPNNFELNVVGNPDLDADYSKLLRQTAGGKHIQFLGPLAEAAKTRVLEESDVLIASSCVSLYNGKKIEQAELLGLVLIEAVAAGVLPVASDTSPFPEVMANLGLGEYVYPQRDSGALNRILQRYEALDDQSRTELRRRSQALLRQHYLFDDYWHRVRAAIGMRGPE